MPRMRILTPTEQAQFDEPPDFSSVERKRFFDITPRVREILHSLRSPENQVGFVVTLGYFKATKRFFARQFRSTDIEYVSRYLGFLPQLFDADDYNEGTFRHHQKLIRELLGFRRFDEDAKELVIREIRSMVRSQERPKFILCQVIQILEHRKIELPSSWLLTELVLDEINHHKRELTRVIDSHLPKPTRSFLDGLFDKSGPDAESDAIQRSKLALLKRISQSTKPLQIKGTVDDFTTLRNLYRDVEATVAKLDLTPEGVKYFANSVVKSQVFQISRRLDEDRHLHLVCFVAHQCFRLQDTLVDILLKAVQHASSSCEREHKEIYYDGRKERRNKIRRFLNRVNQGVCNPLGQIESIAYDDGLDDGSKIRQIQNVFESAMGDRETATLDLADLQTQLEPHAADAEYFQALESRSLKLQNRVSEIIKVVEFHGSDTLLMQAISHYKEKDGAIVSSAPADFLDPDERKTLTGDDGKFRVSLYKALLFLRVADAVKAGSLNLILSYKYRSLDDYLIPLDAWKANREDYLERAELVQACDCPMTLKTLASSLHQQYQLTNCHILNGANSHLKFHKDGSFHVTTPKLDEHDSEPLGGLFPSERYISLLEVLSSVNRLSHFLNAFEHWQTKYARAKPPNKTFFAGIIATGCFIGTRKMAKISTSINASELESTVNAYFSLENLVAANDLILKVMATMHLPEMCRNEPGVLHTSSDGQKYEVSVDSLNANYSFKYFGKEQGVTAYRFLDEREFDWAGDVISSGEKEAHFVIDGLMHNDVVKSNIHSTDTDGYSEVIFGVMHLLGFRFAPRLKNLKTKTIYSFQDHPRKVYQDQGFKILPVKYVNEDRIQKKWDDILRFVATVKLKHATASQLFKRLNSYSKQHPLYTALKEYGRIPKSEFILKYIDVLEFRQAIEKQLNKGENSNKFSKAVSIGNNQEFLHGEKVEQQIAEACKRLIKNAIVCWNYVYATQLIASESNPERRQELLEIFRRGSLTTWQHINLHGEYDFSDEKMEDSVGLKTPKNLELSAD
ncbi:MAG: Tn3 family transposase [Pirellulaceae bacterium]